MEPQQHLPRGIRNNNPLNLRISNNSWLGKVKYNTDGSFEQFHAMIYGIRAAIVNIRTIVRRNGELSLRGLISIWAPSSDGNNVQAYITQVSNLSSIKKDDFINIKDREQIAALVHAMAIVENGKEYISRFECRNAYDLIYPEFLSYKDKRADTAAKN